MTFTFPGKKILGVLQGKRLIGRRSRRWASLGLIASSILIVGTTAIISYWLIRQIILDGMKANALLTVEKAGDEIDQWLATRQAEVETLANQLAIRSMNLEAVIPFLSLESDRLPDYRFLMYGYPDGSYYRTDVGLVTDKPMGDRPYFQKALAGEPNVSSLLRSSADEKTQQQISIAAPIWSVPPLKRSISEERAAMRAENLAAFGLPDNPYEKPKPIGVLVGVIPTRHIAEVVTDIPKDEGSYAFILDAEGMPIVQPDSNLLQPGKSALNTTDSNLADVYKTMVGHKRGVQRVNFKDRWIYVAYAPLRQANWSLALVIPREQVERRLDALNTLALVVGGLLAIASAIALQQVKLLDQAEERSALLTEVNAKLQQEIRERKRVEAELLETQVELENRVAARTVDLAEANLVLQASETQLKQQAHQLEQALKELQQTQSHLVQTEKMSSLGQLIAGVAHEINNPINFIHANLPHADRYVQDLIQLVQTYQQYYSNPEPEIQAQAEAIDLEFLMEDLSKLLASMRIGTERIRQLVLSLRNFSRLDEAAMKEVDIHEGIDNTLLILQNRLKPTPDRPSIQIIREYNNPFLVECYAGQLNQVFMNILANAIEALEEAPKNREASASNLHSGLTEVSPNAPSSTPTIWICTAAGVNDTVEIRIADNGHGMSEEVRHKIFDPFFTTKPVGKGTGIGMAISYQIIVEKHGGQLQCSSEPGKGAEFIIRIPVKQRHLKALAPDASCYSSKAPQERIPQNGMSQEEHLAQPRA